MTTSEITTGTDAIRAALRVRGSKTNTAGLARDLGVSSATLDAFADGRAMLKPEVLQALAADLFHGHAVFDPAIDRLRPAVQAEPRPLGVRPDPIDPKLLPTYSP